MEKSVILHALLSLSSPGLEDHTNTHSPSPDCYGFLGCFPVGGAWAGPERPVSLPPRPLDQITPTFCAYTPTRAGCHILDVNHLSTFHNSSLDPDLPLVVITHGYLESAEIGWIQRMVESLLTSGVGVVTVDWFKAATPPYAQAVANVRLIGAVTGYLLHILAYYEVDMRKVHLVGHSLGAHLMSYAGDYIKTNRGEKVRRITGLDPAGPYFTNTSPEVRLDPSDAIFVDVIHTDIPTESWHLTSLGHPDPIGHVDFYPNGGSEQAGCRGSAYLHIENKKNVAGGVLFYIGCNHQRSHDFFIESILSKCQFIGVVCETWQQYQQGKCWDCENTSCASMGFHARPFRPSHVQNNNTKESRIQYNSSITEYPQGHNERERQSNNGHFSTTPNEVGQTSLKVFLGTNGKTPYCAEQYRVSVVTALTPASVQSGGDLARFTVWLRGHQGQHTIPSPDRLTFVEPGGRMMWLGFCPSLGALHTLQVQYEKDHGILLALIWRFTSPAIYVDAFLIEELSTGSMTRFPFCGRKMQAGESYTLFPNNDCQSTD
ncbi:pancreatic lipase-related protein 2-like [Panulirus ornatus]|uniref:pancreatic lipase-related protein 2-like n=1 Tax=Panulirus ornatus TaxID=150431 RepID=UPI003A863F49